ncbi:SDR family oxidoreductase [Hymenobacter sp. ASUV-10]|uniref:SDR family oxidoreductase n=1 Tax=Hymenobacter aranciens TaxID=3063996 RepID=A0ABT9BCN1_9BACT|nr:SDR family oxidoreductase [Hymenobacter sp. ASUV-10]MDO7874767.1 SDR family oxidoreductase [Hymenobacter sp. ASUV-10]
MSLQEEPLFSTEEWQACLKVLQILSRNPHLADDSPQLQGLVAKLNQKARKSKRKQTLQQQQESDRAIKENTFLCRQESDTPLLPALPELPAVQPEGNQYLHRATRCYVCKGRYVEVHAFYHLLCPACARLNFDCRFQRTELRGRIALLTGGRIKIGFETALKLLRDGARVIVTTRFPQDAISRYAKETDFERWKDRLQIYSLDLRDVRAVEDFIGYLKGTLSHLDIIINNAAQTIRRPRAFYESLLLAEGATPANQALLATPSHIKSFDGLSEALPSYFPTHLLDRHGQQVDLRPHNSWRLRLEEVETAEWLEVHLVNAMAPFLLNSKLQPLLLKSPFERRFIVNVSAMEGQFNRASKTAFHPHTNMAKAALNMMTRTSAAAYARDRIYMNSVDTGWITDEDPHPRKARKRSAGFVPPLDELDGAARIYDPIVRGINQPQEPLSGYFLKDYQPHPW